MPEMWLPSPKKPDAVKLASEIINPAGPPNVMLFPGASESGDVILISEAALARVLTEILSISIVLARELIVNRLAKSR
jgi:hypothetical protein